MTNSHTDTLEKMFNETQRILPCWGWQIASERLQRVDFTNSLCYKISQSKIQPQKLPISRDFLKNFNDLQKLMGDINWLWSIIGSTTQELSNLFQMLQGDSDLNSPIWLTAEAERKLTLVEERLQNA